MLPTGTKTVYVKYKDAANNWSSAYSDSINLAKYLQAQFGSIKVIALGDDIDSALELYWKFIFNSINVSQKRREVAESVPLGGTYTQVSYMSQDVSDGRPCYIAWEVDEADPLFDDSFPYYAVVYEFNPTYGWIRADGSTSSYAYLDSSDGARIRVSWLVFIP